MGTHTTAEVGTSRSASFRLLGLGFWQAWWMLALCTSTILPFRYIDSFFCDPILLVLGFSTLGYLVVVAMSRRFAPFLAKRHFLVAASLCSCIGTLAMGLLSAGVLGDDPVVPYIVATVLFSFGNALLLIMWGELWSTLATGRVGRFLYVSYAFAFVLYFIIDALPLWVKIVIIALLPVVSIVILGDAQKEPRREPSAIPFDMEQISLFKVFIYLVFISFAYGVSQVAVVALSPTSDFIPPMFMLAGACIVALALNIIITQPPVEALTLYQPIIPALAIGLILMAMLPGNLAFIGGGLAVLAAYSLDMLIMLVSTDISFRRRIPVALTFGLSIFVARIGTFAGTVYARQPLGSDGLSVLGSMQHVLLVCAIVVILVGTLVFTVAELQKLYRPRTPELLQTESLKDKCDRIGHMCGLTARELEVLTLLSAGRSIPYICDELSIAKGTAKHHVSSVYRKLGIGDRQSLLDVIEQGSAGKGAL